MKKQISLITLGLMFSVALFSASLAESKAGFGDLFLNGETVGTVVNPANIPNGGSDLFYAVTNGASGQLGIAGIGPGEQGFKGGSWAFNSITFVDGVTPYILDSDEAVLAAESAGDVIITRIPANDFRCPITN